jgi:hypothetical protein
MPPSDGATPVACGEPDRSCPTDSPYPGAPCEGDLMCEYDSFLYECLGTSWSAIGCPGCSPPLVDGCRDPFAGSLSGATVEIGTGGFEPFRPLRDGDRAGIVLGGQGLPMIEFRMRIDHAEPPDCVSMNAMLTYEGMTVPSMTPVRVRCGQTLGTFIILPECPFEPRLYDVTLSVDVPGVGSVTRNLQIMGGMCPRGGKTG